MVEPLINNEKSQWTWLKLWNFGATQKIAEWFAKILWRKKFQKSAIQEHDDQIVEVVKEVYLSPEKRADSVGDRVLDRETSYMVHAAYKHCRENIVLVCYRGTDFKDMKDLFSDVQIVLWVNWIDNRVQQSLDFFDDVQMKYPNTRKWVCGHSLWWTISYVVAKHRSPERCVVFNPWASPTASFIWMMKDTLFRKEWTKCITTYKIWWDVVSTLSFIGNVKNFVVKSASPLTLHTINSFPELFEKMKNEK